MHNKSREAKKEVSFVKAEDFPKVPFVIDGISSRFIRQSRVIPLDIKDNVLKLVMADPGDLETVDAFGVALNGAEIEVFASDPDGIEEYLSRFYSEEAGGVNKIISDMEGREAAQSEAEEDVSHLKDLASEAPIIRLVNLLISRAVESRASDIHIEPFEEEIKVRYRIDGVLHDVESAPKRLQAAIVSRVKIMARLNIAERRLPQDGRIRIKAAEREIDLRVSTIPVIYGESVVMRILDKGASVVDMGSLGFPGDTLGAFDELIRRPNGIILVTGPTGSGKTTTLYAALQEINSPEDKIITVEDPVEYQIRGINQIQVKPQIGLNFANTLRHIVRQDPDIIMIGEVRDLETAEIAIQSALTGHLVFSTLHTNDAPSTITRLLDMGVESFLLSSTIRGILAQRLVRVICPSCRTEDTEERKGDLSAMGIPPDAGLMRGKGCEKCSFTGFYGRTGIFELLMVDDEIRKLITKKAESGEIRSKAVKLGMRTLLEDGVQKVKDGVTTLDELMRVIEEQ
jgi:general secretion pathway protein E